MPVWHQRTERWREQGRLATAGIVLEQHPDRARLFMQWKEMDWPVGVDPFNLLGLDAVPKTLFIDERGVIRLVNPDPGDLDLLERAFLDSEPTNPSPPPVSHWTAPTPALAHAVDLTLWEDEDRLDDAVLAAEEAVASADGDLEHFALAVIYRKRFDSPYRRSGDFARAVRSWQQALELDPNNYIWRRRLQQYGPRLSKPYAFYDWVPVARRELTGRGQQPVPLVAEPGGAELATPVESVAPTAISQSEPDPEDRIARDEDLVDVEAAVVPASVPPGDAVRVHVYLTPNSSKRAHWNNEAEPLLVWFDAPAGWQIETPSHVVPNASTELSSEQRHVDFELRTPPDAEPGRIRLGGYALYYVCEGLHGVCTYRRRDISLDVTVAPNEPLADRERVG